MKMKNSLCLTLFLSIFTFFTCPVYSKTIECHPDDSKALMQIKAAFGNPYYLTQWDPISNPDCCNWPTIICDDKYRITYIDIREADISGYISEAIGDLPELKQFTLKHLTNLTGTIPPSITKLTNLMALGISYTNHSGPIPTFLTKLINLTSLDLSFNHLTGSFPPEFNKLNRLQILYLNWNKLTGTIPEISGHFTQNIHEIHLSHNQLTGTIPKSLGNSNLMRLDLSHNNLTGDASFLFRKKNTIQYLDLSRNNLTFDLSKVVQLPESFTYLDLNHNKIYGSIPQQFNQLKLLNVSYNRLCRQIPQGGNLQTFDNSSYFHNRCLCGTPLPLC